MFVLFVLVLFLFRGRGGDVGCYESVENGDCKGVFGFQAFVFFLFSSVSGLQNLAALRRVAKKKPLAALLRNPINPKRLKM